MALASKGTRCVLPKEKKLAILTMIRDKKAILFGKFTTELENANKLAAWDEILTKAKALQMVTADRNYQYVRDQLYGQWKTRALEKRDNAGKTGTSGGKARKVDEVDLFIYDLLGSDTPTVIGIQGSESGRHAGVLNEEPENECQENPSNHPDVAPSIPDATTSSCGKKTKKKHVNDKELIEKKRKIQINVLELEAYKIKLECFKLERDLFIQHSDLTKDLADKILFIEDT